MPVDANKTKIIFSSGLVVPSSSQIAFSARWFGNTLLPSNRFLSKPARPFEASSYLFICRKFSASIKDYAIGEVYLDLSVHVVQWVPNQDAGSQGCLPPLRQFKMILSASFKYPVVKGFV